MGDGSQEGGIVIEQGLSVEMLPGASRRMTLLPYPALPFQVPISGITAPKKGTAAAAAGQSARVRERISHTKLFQLGLFVNLFQSKPLFFSSHTKNKVSKLP